MYKVIILRIEFSKDGFPEGQGEKRADGCGDISLKVWV